eukprot:3597270-Pyramimonas_sp.AAC.1
MRSRRSRQRRRRRTTTTRESRRPDASWMPGGFPGGLSGRFECRKAVLGSLGASWAPVPLEAS